MIKAIKIREQNKSFQIYYYEGRNADGDDLPKSTWKFVKVFEQILSTFTVDKHEN